MRELYSRYALSRHDIHPLEVFAHEVYKELGCLFCFVDRGSEYNGTVLCPECNTGPMHFVVETEARNIEGYFRKNAPAGIDYSCFMIAGDLYLELQDK